VDAAALRTACAALPRSPVFSSPEGRLPRRFVRRSRVTPQRQGPAYTIAHRREQERSGKGPSGLYRSGGSTRGLPPPRGSLPRRKSRRGFRYRSMGGSKHQRGRSPQAVAQAADHNVSQESASISSTLPNRVAPAWRASGPSSQSNAVTPSRSIDQLSRPAVPVRSRMPEATNPASTAPVVARLNVSTSASHSCFSPVSR